MNVGRSSVDALRFARRTRRRALPTLGCATSRESDWRTTGREPEENCGRSVGAVVAIAGGRRAKPMAGP
jgi:hypothetical protein